MTARIRAECVALDERDPVRHLRERFVLPPGLIYLDGNSLGMAPRAALERVAEVAGREWAQGLIRSWNDAGWWGLPRRLGDKLAPLLGAGPGEVVVTDNITVNLFKLLSVALEVQAERDPARRVIVSERRNFPTDLYVAEGLIRQLARGHELRLVDDPAEIPAALGPDTAVMALTQVNYRTGELLDMRGLTALAHERGALALWDLAHSAGAVEVDLTGAHADFAVGCTYKFLNAGPGAPAFLWVPERFQDRPQPLSGWWGHASPFAMTPGYAAAPGISRFLTGSQPIVSMAAVECGLDVFLETDMATLRRKSLALTDLFIGLVEERCGAHPLRLVTPREHHRRGSQVSLEHPEGYAVIRALIERGVVGDYREPRILRFGFTPLYLGFADIWDAVETLRDVLDTRAWDRPDLRERATVT